MCERVRFPSQAVLLYFAFNRRLRAWHGDDASTTTDSSPSATSWATSLEKAKENSTLETEAKENVWRHYRYSKCIRSVNFGWFRFRLVCNYFTSFHICSFGYDNFTHTEEDAPEEDLSGVDDWWFLQSISPKKRRKILKQHINDVDRPGSRYWFYVLLVTDFGEVVQTTSITNENDTFMNQCKVKIVYRIEVFVKKETFAVAIVSQFATQNHANVPWMIFLAKWVQMLSVDPEIWILGRPWWLSMWLYGRSMWKCCRTTKFQFG